MQLVSIDTYFPEAFYTQLECIEAMRGASFWQGLEPRSRRILEKIFSSDTGIQKRHFALDDLDAVWGMSAEQLNHHYECSAPRLGAAALLKALERAGLEGKDLDVLLVCSCTGYLCPGLSGYLAEALGCKDSLHTQDVTGHGCGAAIPLLQIADGYSAAMPDAVIATVAVEVSSAAFYISDDADVLISTCLFGDGAAACLWSSSGGGLSTHNFRSLLLPQEREKVRFTNSGGKLKNQLDRAVPSLSADAAAHLLGQSGRPTKLLTHGGGRDVIQALEARLSVAQLSEAREVLAAYGNLSSPSVLVALKQYLDQNEGGAAAGDALWLCSFGAGFSAHSVELR